MENYKALEAYKFYIDGWVQTIKHVKLKGATLMKADVRPSFRTTSHPHKPWIALNDSGDVLTAHCDCMAGLGETCSHIAAMLYKVEAAVRIGLTSVTPTDLPCKWNQNFTKNVFGSPVAEINLYTDKAKAKLTTKPKVTSVTFNTDEFNEFLGEINNVSPKTVALSLFSSYQESFTRVSKPDPKAEILKLPPSLRSLYGGTSTSLTSEEYVKLAEKTVQVLKENYSAAEYIYIEEATRNQAQSFAWFQQRAGRITGSTFMNVWRSSIDNPSKSMVTSLCSDQPKCLNVPAILWGKEHEQEAIDLYRDVHSSPNYMSDCVPIVDCFLHEDFEVQSIGLVIYPDKPWYAASPDAVVYCKCCSYGTVEVKCPYSIREKSLREEINRGEFYITLCGGDYKLKESHQYYFQVQLQLLATETAYCDFVVWTPNEFLCIRIQKNMDFLTQAIEKCDIFWREVILKELLFRTFENEDSNKVDDEFCEVCKKDNDYMMKCKSCQKIFHPECVGRKTLAKMNTWECKNCKPVSKK